MHTSTGTKRRVNTTKGYEIFIQWKDRITTWNTLKNVKDLYPVQMAEFAVENRIPEEPTFAWWVKYVLKKRDKSSPRHRGFGSRHTSTISEYQTL